MVYAELDKDLIDLAINHISLDIENAESKWDVSYCHGTYYLFVNNGQEKLYQISQKYSTKEILPEQMKNMFLPAIISLKCDESKQNEILSVLHDKIKESVKNNTIVLPVTGIVVDASFKIGRFTLYPKMEYIQEKKNVLNKFDCDCIEKDFPATLAVAELQSHPNSANEIGIGILKSELNRLKAFIPYLRDSTKHWIHPLKTDVLLLEQYVVFGDYGGVSGMSHVANTQPLYLEAKNDKPTSISFREFLNGRMNFSSIIDGKTDFWQALNIGYEWLGKEYDEEKLENKLIYSIFALECLLSNVSNFSSISAAIAEKCAFLVGETVDDRIKIFNQAKDLYNLRSALVHGYSKNPVTEEKVWQAYWLAMEVYRRVTKMLVAGDITNQKDFEKYILNKKFEMDN
ncbi:MAG: HEPN domain-containing protein [Fibrobacter sp.]|nr:HEPN domain-containing protein [Fibrobacter sp.]